MFLSNQDLQPAIFWGLMHQQIKTGKAATDTRIQWISMNNAQKLIGGGGR
jgi:hypothetical protein